MSLLQELSMEILELACKKEGKSNEKE